MNKAIKTMITVGKVLSRWNYHPFFASLKNCRCSSNQMFLSFLHFGKGKGHVYSKNYRMENHNTYSKAANCIEINSKMLVCLASYKRTVGYFVPQRSASNTSGSTMNIFDRKMKMFQRDWAAKLEDGKVYDYLRDEIGSRVADRVYDITRKFEVAVELGCGRGHVIKHLTNENIGMVYQCDLSKKMVEVSEISENIPTFKIAVDEEHLPFRDNSVDIFISSLNFHWINDLPGTFQKIHSALKPDGVLIAAMFCGDTLFELRTSLQLAETETKGGISPHVSPFTRVRDIGDLLSTAGYKMITIDIDELKVNYPGILELMRDLRGMAETNASWNRTVNIGKKTLLAAAATYKKMYGNDDGTIPATFDILYLIGWKAHESQAKPAKRGSGTVSLKDISSLTKNVT